MERRDLHNPPVSRGRGFDGNINFGKFVDAEERSGKRLSELAGWLAGYRGYSVNTFTTRAPQIHVLPKKQSFFWLAFHLV